MLTYNPRRSRLPYLFLKDVCNERTIEWEVVSAASVNLAYDLDCSPCLDVSWIKWWLTDAVIGRVITGLRTSVLGINTHGGDTIQVVCPLFPVSQAIWKGRWWLCDDFTPGSSGASRKTATDLGGRVRHPDQ